MYVAGLAVAIFAVIHLTSFLKFSGEWVLGYASSITVNEVVTQINDERAEEGLPPLVVNRQLSQAALAKGQDMMQDQYWSHFAPDGKEPWDFINESGYAYLAAGENLARDFSNTYDMVVAWMDSPTHRANIVNPKYKETGVAVIDGVFQGVETTLVVQMFGSSRQVAAAVSEQGSEAAGNPQVVSLLDDLNTSPFNTSPDDTKTALNQEDEGSSPLDTAVIPTQPGVGTLTQTETQLDQSGMPVTQVTLSVPDLTAAPLLSPLQLSKAFFLAIVLLIISTLVYDTIVISNKTTLRFVGKNIAHILFLMMVGYLVLFFKGGLIQ